MKTMDRKLHTSLTATMLAAALAVAGCASNPETASRLDEVRQDLDELQSNPKLATRAPVAIRDAEQAIDNASGVDEDSERYDHLVFIADKQVDIARAQAMKRMYVAEREDLLLERDRIRLQARTEEAEQARREARQLAMQAEESRRESDQLRRESEELQRQIQDLNARPTDRGLVLTLSDVLFEVNEATLKPGAHTDLDKLAEFLREYEERDIRILGHTDSTGDESYNMQLSERRADAVRQYLASQGISPRRIVTAGRGESMPIASNDTTTGRQLNRRVEILIENPSVAENERRRR